MSATMEPSIIPPGEPNKGPLVSDKNYDIIKQLVQKGLPAFGALYAGLAVFWHFPNATEVVGSVALFATFLGVFLGIADRRYESSGARYDGAVVVTGDPAQPHSLVFNQPLSELEGQSRITLKVDDSLTTDRK